MKDQKNLTTDKLINSRFDYGLKRECAVQYKNIGQLISSTKWDYLQHLSIWNNFIEDQKNEPSHFLEAFKALALNYESHCRVLSLLTEAQSHCKRLASFSCTW